MGWDLPEHAVTEKPANNTKKRKKAH